jgi:hypothetical protein
MSVVDPRPAAAQRTAAGRTGRFRIVATWLVAVPLLAFFSFSVVAGAATYDAQPPTQQAVAQLPPTDAVVQLTTSSLLQTGTIVCTVNATQLTAIQKLWRTSTTSITVDKRTVSVVAVYGATDTGLRSALGNPRCVLVQVLRTFFLPFDAHTS